MAKILDAVSKWLAPMGALVTTALACLFFYGADAPSASLIGASLILGFAAIAAVLGRLNLPRTAWLAAGGFLAFFGLAAWRGWLESGAAEYAALAAGGALILVFRSAARDRSFGSRLWALMLIIGGGIAVAALIQFAADPTSWLGRERPYHLDRLAAPFFSANTAASFYGLIALAALATLMRRARGLKGGDVGERIDSGLRRLSLSVIVLILASSALMVTGSRAGVTLGALLSVLLVAWQAWTMSVSGPEPAETPEPDGEGGQVRSGPQIRWGVMGMLVGAALITALAVSLLGEVYSQRLERTDQDWEARATLFSAYWDAVRYAPIFGHGLGGFAYINALSAQADNARLLMTQGSAHNLPLQWLLQTGWTGLAALGALWAAILVALWRGLSTRKSHLGYLRMILIGCLLVLGHGMVDYAVEIPGFMWWFAALLGLGLGFAAPSARRSGGQSTPPARLIAALGFGIGALMSANEGLEHMEAQSLLSESDQNILAIIEAEAEPSGGFARLDVLADRALRLDPPQASYAALALSAAVEAESRNGETWARLAYARALAGVDVGEIDTALGQSYLLMPYADRELRRWRLEFVASVWLDLSPQTRAAALRELRLEGDWWSRRWLRSLPGGD